MFSRFSTMFNNVRIPGGRPGRRDANEGGQGGGGSAPSSFTSTPSSNKKSRADVDIEESGDLQACQVDNSKAIITKIASLYAERLMSDITLVIQGVEYPSHRLILCASSDVFQVMLMNPNFNEARESRVVLLESSECAEVFEDFLKYLYTGRLTLQLTSVLHVLILADKYNVNDLIELCLTYMQAHIPAAANHSQLILWFQYTSNFGLHHAQVSECCRNYIKWNLEPVSKSEDFVHLDLELFLSILSEDDIVIFDEYQLYMIVEYWLLCRMDKSYDCDSAYASEADFLAMVERAMQYIRFPMMNPRQIADLIPSQLVRNCKYLMENMAIAMKFHNGCLENLVEMGDPLFPSASASSSSTISCPNFTSSYFASTNHKQKMFTSRLYCTDQWSVCIATAFDRIQHYQAQTLVFATPCSFSDCVSKHDKQVEWCLDFYPKAVQFQRFCLIGWHGTTEMPEHILKTVRLSVLCRSEEKEDVRVHIGILIAGLQDKVEHVRKVVSKNYIFSERDRVLNIDNLLPYGDLNPCAECLTRNRNQNTRTASSSQSPPVFVGSQQNSASAAFLSASDANQGQRQNEKGCSSCNGAGDALSCFFVGQDQKSVKIRIVITPLP